MVSFGGGTSSASTAYVCPAKPPSDQQLQHTARAGSRQHEVPGQVRSVSVCAYAGVNDAAPGALQSQGSRGLNAAELLQRRLNNGQNATGKVYPCPMDDGRRFFVAFHYANGADQRLDVSRSGCRFASNGKRTVFTTDAIQHQLAVISGQ